MFSCSTALFLAFVIAGMGKSVYAEELTVTVNNGASVAITPSVEGVFASTEDEGNVSASFSVATDNYTGYNLSFTTGNEGEYATKLVNVVTKQGETTIYALNSIGAAVDLAAFSSDSYNNTWGIKPSKYNSAVNTLYLPVVSGMILDNVKQSGTNDYTIAVAVRANYENPAGKYTNTLILTATANPVAYEVPVEFTEEAGVSKVVFTPVGGTEAAATVMTSGGKALLTYGMVYEIETVFEEGYELDGISATSGALNATAGTYKIEIVDEAPVLMVAGKVSEMPAESPAAPESPEVPEVPAATETPAVSEVPVASETPEETPGE